MHADNCIASVHLHMNEIDVGAIRTHFPILNTHVNRDGKTLPFVYLDSAATALKPQSVIDAVCNYYTRYSVNVHRGAYEMSQHATELFETTRVRVAEYFNAGSEYAIIFTKGATEAINLVAYSWAQYNMGHGDEILFTEAEHHANIVPWQQLSIPTSCALRHIPIHAEDYTIHTDAIDTWFSKQTKLLAITGMSNVSGWRPPLQKIIAAARSRGVVTVVDGAQLASHTRIDIDALGCDFFACSVHKMFGPTGLGLLIAKKTRLNTMRPFITGGNVIEEVTCTHSTFKQAPEKFEAGTPHIAGVIGLGATIEWLDTVDFASATRHEHALSEYAYAELSKIHEVELYGGLLQNSNGVIPFNVRNVHAHDVGSILDQEGVAVRAGHHCAQPYHHALAVDSTVRVSFHLYNQPADIHRLLKGIKRAIKIFYKKN